MMISSQSVLREIGKYRTGIADCIGKAGFKGAGCSYTGIHGDPAEPFGEAGYSGYGRHRGKTECGSTALRQRSREKKSQVQQ